MHQPSAIHRRAIGFFFDLITLGIYSFIIGFGTSLVAMVLLGPSYQYYMIVEIIIQLIMHWLYHLVFYLGPFQATPGQKLAGLKVVWKEERASLSKASLRYLIKGATFPIGWLPLLVDGERRALWDMVSGSRVVEDEYAWFRES